MSARLAWALLAFWWGAWLVYTIRIASQAVDPPVVSELTVEFLSAGSKKRP